MAKKRHYSQLGSEPYAGMDSRRAMEARDSMMISEDKSAMANLPQSPVMKYWPREDYAHYSELDDTIRGIDVQIKDDAHGKTIKKMAYPEKY